MRKIRRKSPRGFDEFTEPSAMNLNRPRELFRRIAQIKGYLYYVAHVIVNILGTKRNNGMEN